MFGKYLKYFFILISLTTILRGESEPLYILNGTFYMGNGQWLNPGTFLRITPDEAQLVQKIKKKTAYIDMSHFWVIPAFQNIWYTRNPDSTFRHYPYVQTDIPAWSIKTFYKEKMNQGLVSFYLYPESPYVRSGDLVKIIYPGISVLQGLIINKAVVSDSTLSELLSGSEIFNSYREKNLILQWKNQQLPLYMQDFSILNEPVIRTLISSGYATDTLTCYTVSHIQDIQTISPHKSMIIKNSDPAVLLRDMNLLEDSLKFRILDILTGYTEELPDSLNNAREPHFIFLDRNPLEHESRIKFIMINGTFSLNP